MMNLAKITKIELFVASESSQSSKNVWLRRQFLD